MKKFFLLIFLVLFVFEVYSTQITELKFNDDEYIELYSSQTLNLTNASILKLNDTKSNTIISCQNLNSSPYYLIIGENFANNNNIDNLNCTICITDKSQVAFGGFSKYGENFQIFKYNKSIANSNFTPSISDNQTHSHNFNNITNKYELALINPCKQAIIQNNNISNNTINIPKIENKTINNLSTNICLDNFSINSNIIFEDKIKFKFETKSNNYSIIYWITDYENITVKPKRTTNNKNTKTFTPKKLSNLYIINAILNSKNCSYFANKTIFFYTPQTKSDLQNELNSKIIINNLNEIKTRDSLKLEYEIIKGDTTKTAVNFYFDSNKVLTLYMKKNSQIEGKLELTRDNIKEIKIEGLGEKVIVKLDKIINKTNIIKSNSSNNTKVLKIPENSKPKIQKNYFEIKNISIIYNNLNFTITSNINNLSYICYVLLSRTKVTETIENSNLTKYSLKINNSKIKDKTNTNNLTLKLLCKYKKSHLKTYSYFSKEFNYSIYKIITNNTYNTTNNTIKSSIPKFTNISYSNPISNILESDEKLLEITKTKTKNENFSENQTTKSTSKLLNKNTSISGNIVFESKNNILKQNSFFFIFAGVVILCIILIIKR